MAKRYVDTSNLERYLGYASASRLLSGWQAASRHKAISTCHTIPLMRLHRAWERDKERLDKAIAKLMALNPDSPSEAKERLLLEARIRKYQARMRKWKEKAAEVAARNGVYLDI